MPKKKVDWCAVYVVDTGKAVKVGITNDPDARYRTLQSSMPDDLTMPFFIVLSSRADAVWLEADLHTKLAPHHIRGEWFRASAAQVETLAMQAIRRKPSNPLRALPEVVMPIAQAIALASKRGALTAHLRAAGLAA